MRDGRDFAPLGPGDTVGDLLDHPALAGFARRMLPWDGQDPDRSLPLADIGSLLPYHSHVDAATVLDGLNRMITATAAGGSVFHEVYPPREQAAYPRLRDTGLFFFRGRPGAPFAVIAPGGGFSYVGSVHEGFPYAARISDAGLNAFVLKYRAGVGQQAATEDMARAIGHIRDNARALGVSPQGYALWGSSAGARMAAAIGSHGVAAFGGGSHPGPAAVIMAYTAHADVGRTEPPTFAIVGDRDRIAPPDTMQRRIDRLAAMGTPVEFHRTAGLGHGFGPGQGTAAEGWIEKAIAFWQRHL